jgi:hypothetical protein
MDPHSLADQIRAVLPDVKHGAPRFWGVWHTKPFDPYFQISDSQVEDRHLVLNLIDVDSLSVRYPDGLIRKHELLLHVWSPEGLTCNSETFSISKAERILLESKVGKASSQEPAWSLDLTLRDGMVWSGSSGRLGRHQYASPEKPAVELLKYGETRRKGTLLSAWRAFLTSRRHPSS